MNKILNDQEAIQSKNVQKIAAILPQQQQPQQGPIWRRYSTRRQQAHNNNSRTWHEKFYRRWQYGRR